METLVVFVPSFQVTDAWLGLEKWLPLCCSVLEMGDGLLLCGPRWT